MEEKIYLAKTYSNAKIIGEPYTNSKGKRYVKIHMPCPRCGGSGFYGPISVNNGMCFWCGGSGNITKDVRAYTAKEKAAMDNAAECRRQKKQEEHDALIRSRIDNKDQLMKDWFAKHAFNENGITYIAADNDTYSIKEDLKAAGYKYDSVLGWHAAAAAGFKTIEVAFDTIYDWNVLAADAEYKVGAADKIDDLKKSAWISESRGEFVGTIKERLKNLTLKLSSKREIDGIYTSILYVFLDTATGNAFEWFSSSDKGLEVGETYTIDGTVKDFKSYRGINYTILTRCKVIVQDEGAMMNRTY